MNARIILEWECPGDFPPDQDMVYALEEAVNRSVSKWVHDRPSRIGMRLTTRSECDSFHVKVLSTPTKVL